MKKYFISLIPLFYILFFFYSCDYETEKDYFVRLEKPTDDVNISINLQNVSEDEIIYIYTTTAIEYEIKSNDKKILDINFELDGRFIQPYNNTIYISPSDYDDTLHTLKVRISLNSNTGSLADKLYLEKYTGEYTYHLRFIKADLKLNISQQTTEEGFLKLIWDTPELKQTPVEKYVVSYYDTEEKTTKHIEIENQTYFIDKNYVYGFREYTIKTHFKDGRISPWTDFFIAEYEELTIEHLNLDLRQERTVDKHLKLIWNNPQIKRMPIQKYILEYYDKELGGWMNIDLTPDNSITTSFIDNNYAYGDREYRLTLDFDYLTLNTKYIPIYRKLTIDDLIFQDISLDTVRVSWPENEFACLQVIRLFDQVTLKVEKGANHFDFKRLDFPGKIWQQANIVLLSFLGENSNYDPNYSQGSILTRYLYNRINIQDNFLSYQTDIKNNLIYTVAREGIYSTNMESKETRKHLSFKETIDVSMSCSQFSSKIAVRDYKKVYIYNDQSFTNPITFDLQYGIYSTANIIYFTSDGKLLLSMNSNGIITLVAFDANNGKYLYTIPIDSEDQQNATLKISADGKYIALSSYNYTNQNSSRIDILEIIDDKTKLIKRFTYDEMETHGSSVFFNPANPNQFIQGYRGKFRIFTLPYFNVLAEVKGSILSIDYINGNILYTKVEDDYRLFITDPTLSKELLSMKLNEIDIISYNNILISSDMSYWGYYFDVSKFIKQ